MAIIFKLDAIARITENMPSSYKRNRDPSENRSVKIEVIWIVQQDIGWILLSAEKQQKATSTTKRRR